MAAERTVIAGLSVKSNNQLDAVTFVATMSLGCECHKCHELSALPSRPLPSPPVPSPLDIGIHANPLIAIHLTVQCP